MFLFDRINAKQFPELAKLHISILAIILSIILIVDFILLGGIVFYIWNWLGVTLLNWDIITEAQAVGIAVTLAIIRIYLRSIIHKERKE